MKKTASVRVKLVKRDRKNKRWHFECWSNGDKHHVTIKGNGVGTLTDLDAKVSCTCPAFLYWGPDYWASIGRYLDIHDPSYTTPRSKHLPPDEKDPNKQRLLCKHIAAAYDEWKDVKFPTAKDIRGTKMNESRQQQLAGIINESQEEFIIWGLPPGEKYEVPLHTKSKSKSEAEKIMKILADKHGCTKMRIQILDFKTMPNFAKTLNKG